MKTQKVAKRLRNIDEKVFYKWLVFLSCVFMVGLAIFGALSGGLDGFGDIGAFSMFSALAAVFAVFSFSCLRDRDEYVLGAIAGCVALFLWGFSALGAISITDRYYYNYVVEENGSQRRVEGFFVNLFFKEIRRVPKKVTTPAFDVQYKVTEDAPLIILHGEEIHWRSAVPPEQNVDITLFEESIISAVQKVVSEIQYEDWTQAGFDLTNGSHVRVVTPSIIVDGILFVSNEQAIDFQVTRGALALDRVEISSKELF